MSVKKALNNAVELNPKKHFDNANAIIKRDLKHKPPTADTSAQEAALEQQRLDAAKLDEEENRRRKRLFGAAEGIRAFAGSPMFRRAAGDRAGSSAASASPGYAAPGARSGSPGRRGGGRGTSMIP